MPKPRDRVVTLVGLLLSCAISAAAEDKYLRRPRVVQAPLPGLQYVLLEGATLHDGSLRVTILPAYLATNGLRIYSEPSHTLLPVLSDQGCVGTKAGRDGHSQAELELPRAKIISRLPGSPPKVTTEVKPLKKEWFSVGIYGRWEDGRVEEKLISDGMLGANSFFGYSSFMLLGDLVQHCCSSDDSSSVCETCPGSTFTCCVQGPSDCGSIKCGYDEQCLGPSTMDPAPAAGSKSP